MARNMGMLGRRFAESGASPLEQELFNRNAISEDPETPEPVNPGVTGLDLGAGPTFGGSKEIDPSGGGIGGGFAPPHAGDDLDPVLQGQSGNTNVTGTTPVNHRQRLQEVLGKTQYGYKGLENAEKELGQGWEFQRDSSGMLRGRIKDPNGYMYDVGDPSEGSEGRNWVSGGTQGNYSIVDRGKMQPDQWSAFGSGSGSRNSIPELGSGFGGGGDIMELVNAFLNAPKLKQDLVDFNIPGSGLESELLKRSRT